ncbi:MAG TPA: YceI family protein [Anaeromyxobacteraceae bacterium]|nr:YceI family protein [Anaeromyxobacteraceae bacterium]
MTSGYLLAVLLSAGLPSGSLYTAVPAQSVVRYTVIHKLHEVEGVSRDVEAKALVKEDGSAVAQARVPVASFHSGDANRDSHMLEAVDAGRYPFVTVKAAIQLGPTRELPDKAIPADAEVDFHGIKRRMTIPFTLVRQPGGELRVRGSFDVSLDAHGVARPSLLFVKIDDACRIDLDIVFRGAPR